MSAALLNSATPPGAPGAGAGVAAQAAQAAQSHGPLAGFEAMLAAFFGDQGLVAPAIGAPVIAGQAVGGQPGAAAGKTVAKAAGATGAGKDAAADTDKTAAGAAADTAASAVDAALALMAPVAPNAQQAAASATPGASDGTPDAGLGGKPSAGAALAQLTAAVAASDAKTAKAAGVLAQDTTQAPAAGAPAQAAKGGAQGAPQTPTDPSPQTPGLFGQADAAATALPTPPVPNGPVAGLPDKAANPAVGGKDKIELAKGVRVEGARSEAPPTADAGKSGVAVPAFADNAGKDASSSERDPNGPAAAEAKPAAADSTQGAGDFNLAANSTGAVNPAMLAHAAAVVRGAPQTVANLAAQIAKKLDGRSTRFDVQLDPAGLGKVDVRVEIDAAGKMTAAMNFDNQQAANELRSRAGELQKALEQAGFDMSGGLSFDVAGQGGQGGRAPGQEADTAPAFRGRAFQAVLDGAADAPSAIQSSFSRAGSSGVDIRI